MDGCDGVNTITKSNLHASIKFPYTTPSTVKEVSAMFVETINRLQFGGGGLNTRTCWVITNMKHQPHRKFI